MTFDINMMQIFNKSIKNNNIYAQYNIQTHNRHTSNVKYTSTMHANHNVTIKYAVRHRRGCERARYGHIIVRNI